MPTRYYPTMNSPGVIYNGRLAGDWDVRGVTHAKFNPVQWTHRLSRTKDTGTQTASTIRNNQAAPYAMAWRRFVTPPLAAQTISGTLDLCFRVACDWSATAVLSADATAAFHVHAYIAVGDTPVVRHVLLDDYIDATTFPRGSLAAWRQLTSAQALTAGDTLAGDVIVIELGFQIVTTLTPTPNYPPDHYALVVFGPRGANSGFADATSGVTSTSRAPWFEFSAALTEQSAPAAPANDACADAIVIPATLPYESPAVIDTTTSTDTNRAVWFEWTAPSNDPVAFSVPGTNYNARITVYTGGCGALVQFGTQSDTNLWAHRCQAFLRFTPTSGVTYTIKVDSVTSTICAPNSGGALRVYFYTVSQTPQEDDLYLPNQHVYVMRDGAVVNRSATLGITQKLTGLALDYTGRAMADFNGGTHTGVRALVGYHDSQEIDVIDAATLNVDENIIDFFIDWASGTHVGQLAVTLAGLLYACWFGNGYRYVAGEGTEPFMLDSVGNPVSQNYIRELDAVDGSSQVGAPFVESTIAAAIDRTSPWALAIDEAAGILYYTSSNVYVSTGGTAHLVKRWDLTNNVQLADLPALTLLGTDSPGLRGLAVLGNGDLLVCNGPSVQRLTATGTILQTFTPANADDAVGLVDVKPTADGTAFWVADLYSTRLFKFELATGNELATAQHYGLPETLLQMAIYQPNGTAVPPTTDTACVTAPVKAACWGGDALVSAKSIASSPSAVQGACWSAFDPDAVRVGLINPDVQP